MNGGFYASGADASAELVGLDQVVGRNGDQAAVANLHFAMELQEPFVLPPVFWTETSARGHQHQRIAPCNSERLRCLPRWSESS